jgi:hypothetical protein
LIVPLETPDLHGRSEVELYDLTNDPGELTNVAETYPEVTEQLKAKLESWVARRVEETGLPDPLPIQPIPLRRIGRMDAALPRDKRLTGEEKEPKGDEKQPEGDFIGYEREEAQKNG